MVLLHWGLRPSTIISHPFLTHPNILLVRKFCPITVPYARYSLAVFFLFVCRFTTSNNITQTSYLIKNKTKKNTNSLLFKSITLCESKQRKECGDSSHRVSKLCTQIFTFKAYSLVNGSKNRDIIMHFFHQPLASKNTMTGTESRNHSEWRRRRWIAVSHNMHYRAPTTCCLRCTKSLSPWNVNTVHDTLVGVLYKKL